MRSGLAEMRSFLPGARCIVQSRSDCAQAELALLNRKPILMSVGPATQDPMEMQMDSSIVRHARPNASLLVLFLAAAAFASTQAAHAQQTRATGLDVSYYQGILSQANWDTIHNTDGRAFT